MALDDSTPQPRTACLYVTKGASAGTLIELHGQMVVGRDPGCDIVILDESISQDHALFWERDGQVTLSDVASTNGTSVNGVEITRQVALRSGDSVRLGGVMLEYIERPCRPQLATAPQAPERTRGGLRTVAGLYSESSGSGSRHMVDWMPCAVARYAVCGPDDNGSR